MPCWHCQRARPSSGKSRFDQPPVATTILWRAVRRGARAHLDAPPLDSMPAFPLGDELDGRFFGEGPKGRHAVRGAQ